MQREVSRTGAPRQASLRVHVEREGRKERQYWYRHGKQEQAGWLRRSAQLIQSATRVEETGLQETQKMLQQQGHFLGDATGRKYLSDHNRPLPGGEPRISTPSNYL